MSTLKTLFTALAITAFTLPLGFATPSPTRTFTVQAYQSPYPTGTGLTGYYLAAKDGTFFLTKDAPKSKPVLEVDQVGKATLSTGAQVFLDTADGHLGYTAPSAPAGAIFTNFLHLGSGNAVFTPQPSFAAEPPGVFQWLGSSNNFWFACFVSEGQYKLFKQMTFSIPNLNGCNAIELAALDNGK